MGWSEGVNWGGSNELVIKTGSNGLTIKPTGDTSISGNLEVGKDDVMHNTTIEPYIQIHNNYQGSTGYVRIYQSRDYARFLD